jgi:ribose transport system substrate-binding protein
MPAPTFSRRALAAMLAAAPACQRSRGPLIGVIPQGQSHMFWQSIHAGAVAASREFAVEILWNGPPAEGDYSGQLKVIDAMISRRVRAIVLCPADRQAMAGAVERAVRQGIPVVIADTDVDTPVYTARVATNNYAAGCLAAERLAAILNQKGKVVMVAVQPGIASTMARELGFEDTMRKYPAIQIVDKRYGQADFARSLQAAENMLTAHADLAGMFASNESSTVGAVQALRNRPTHVKLVGFDWSPTLAEALQSGLVDSLVAQDPFRMGYDAVKAAVEKMNGGTPQRIQDLPPLLVTKENMSEPAVQKRLNPDLKKYL